MYNLDLIKPSNPIGQFLEFGLAQSGPKYKVIMRMAASKWNLRANKP